MAGGRTPVDSSDPILLLIVVIAVALFGAVAFGLARLVRRRLRSVPGPLKLIVCAALVPVAVIAIGFVFFVDDMTFSEWLASRPLRAFRNVALIFAVSLLGARLGLRERKANINPAVFD